MLKRSSLREVFCRLVVSIFALMLRTFALTASSPVIPMMASIASLLAPSMFFWRFHSVCVGESTGGRGGSAAGGFAVGFLTCGLGRPVSLLFGAGAGVFAVEGVEGPVGSLRTGLGGFGSLPDPGPAALVEEEFWDARKAEAV